MLLRLNAALDVALDLWNVFLVSLHVHPQYMKLS